MHRLTKAISLAQESSISNPFRSGPGTTRNVITVVNRAFRVLKIGQDICKQFPKIMQM
jgi:hypothetical protein